MTLPTASIWPHAPKLAIPGGVALFYDDSGPRLWACYAVAFASEDSHAVVQFDDVIDHHLSPINDEGLGSHPYMGAGLRPYEFNELVGSVEARHWVALAARHWVVTFKDNTLDVLACDAKVLATDLLASDAAAALMAFLANYR